MTPEDPGMSQRERRRQEFQKNKPKVRMEKQDLKKWIGPVALLLLVGGVVAIMVVSDSDGDALGCSGHYHYTLDIFVDGEKVLLNAPGDDKFTRVGSNLHMHSTDPNTGTGLNLVHTHFQGGRNQGLHPENCFSYGEAFDTLSMDVSDQALELRAVHGEEWAGTYPVGDGKTLRLFGKGWDDSEWRALDLTTINGMVPPASSQIAIVYGDAGEDAMALLEAQATPFPVQSYPPDGNPNDPPHYTSFDEMREK